LVTGRDFNFETPEAFIEDLGKDYVDARKKSNINIHVINKNRLNENLKYFISIKLELIIDLFEVFSCLKDTPSNDSVLSLQYKKTEKVFFYISYINFPRKCE
jgi:hypothetical protein